MLVPSVLAVLMVRSALLGDEGNGSVTDAKLVRDLVVVGGSCSGDSKPDILSQAKSCIQAKLSQADSS